MTARFRLKTPDYELNYKPLPKYGIWTRTCCNNVLWLVCGSRKFVCFLLLRSERFVNLLPFTLKAISLANFRIQSFFLGIKVSFLKLMMQFDCFLSYVYNTGLGDLSIDLAENGRTYRSATFTDGKQA
jgi:hypothetical protein